MIYVSWVDMPGQIIDGALRAIERRFCGELISESIGEYHGYPMVTRVYAAKCDTA